MDIARDCCRGGTGNFCSIKGNPPAGDFYGMHKRSVPEDPELRKVEDVFKQKVTECAMVRAELQYKREELEKERCLHKETEAKIAELEKIFNDQKAHTNMLLDAKQQEVAQETSVRMLKKCYREAKDELSELKTLQAEQELQIEDYREKYNKTTQLAEEQQRKMDMLDMDNTRITEQINSEIHKVKLKFQEKLQKLSPIPELLKSTQMKLRDSQHAQAVAEHMAEQVGRELNSARDKIQVLIHKSKMDPDKPEPKVSEDKQVQMLQLRITQITEANVAIKNEVEALKSEVIKMEEIVLANDRQLQVKIKESASLSQELDRIKNETASELQKTYSHTEDTRKCLQTKVAELERQIAISRNEADAARKSREEVQYLMSVDLKRFCDVIEQSELRVCTLNEQVKTLAITPNAEHSKEESDDPCECPKFFNNHLE